MRLVAVFCCLVATAANVAAYVAQHRVVNLVAVVICAGYSLWNIRLARAMR